MANSMELNSNTDGLLLSLSLTIGSSAGSELLSKALPGLVADLKCDAIVFKYATETGASLKFAEGFTDADLQNLQQQVNGLSAEVSAKSPFAVINFNNHSLHVFLLEGYGLLLMRYQQLPEPAFIQKFLPLVTLLSKALCLSEKMLRLQQENEKYCHEHRMFFDIIQNIPDPVYVKDNEGRKIFLNKAEARLLGKDDITEVLGKKDSDFYPEEIARKTEEEDKAIIKSGKPLIHRDGKLTTQHGKQLWLQGTKIPHFDEKGNVSGIIGISNDISERKETEEKLKKLLVLQNLLTHLATEFINMPVENSNEAINRLLTAIGEGNDTDRVFVFDYDFANGFMTNTYEWCGKDVSHEKANLQHIPTRFLSAWVDAHKKGEMYSIEDVSKLEKTDPQYAILRLQGIKSFTSIPLMLHGECFGFVGFNTVKTVKQWSTGEIIFLQVLADLLCNVTDRKRKEEALRNREASLKAIFNNVPFQMWLKDADSKYIAVNQPFMDYFSITSEEEIVGRDAMDIWHNEVGQHFMEQDKLVMQQRNISSVEELIDFKHKSVWFEIFRAPIVDQNGQILGTTGIARDITSRKQADKALQQAVETAQAATEAKSKYLAIMSHEIRNPLNAVVGMVRMLYEAGIEGPNRKLVENIKTSSDHLLMIVNDILDFSKIEAGDMVLEQANFSIHDVVKRVFNSHVYIANDKKIDLNFTIDEKIVKTHIGDPLRLQQVLSNLLSNAIKFTPQGRIDIRCELLGSNGQNDRLRFEVIDTGIGISAERQQLIFESFKQEDSTISRTYGGSGLGLAISKQIVELMGGELKVESAKNEGSRFHFTINLPAAEGSSTQSAMVQQNNGDISLSGYTVLLVEDNKLNQVLATTIIEKWGARVVVAGNGQQALDMLATDTFDIILMDIQMPVMDGMTASRLIREKLKITTPILALSANVIKGIVEKCQEAGMQGYISKPFDSDDLYRKIVLHAPKTGSPVEKPEEMLEPDLVLADVSRLEKMIGSDPEQLNIMINKFLMITPSYLAELNDALALNDIDAVAAAAHKIKSSIDLVSAPVLRELILFINHNSRNGSSISEVSPLIRKFNVYYKLLEKQLRQEISTGKVFHKVG